MLRTLRLIPVFLIALLAGMVASAATLQQISMDQMSQSATAVVWARVVGTSASISGSTIYTRYKLDVSESWKGAAPSEVMLPGGSLNGTFQSFPGVPVLRAGGEYVLFLWTSASTGITHIIGLTQGLFDVASQPDGTILASRKESGELMLDASGRRVSDQSVSMKLADMKARVTQALISTMPAGTAK